MKEIIILFSIIALFAVGANAKDLTNKNISCGNYNSLVEDSKGPTIEAQMNQENLTDVLALLSEKHEAVQKIKPEFKSSLDDVLKYCEKEENSEVTLTDILFIAAAENESSALRLCLSELNELKMQKGIHVVGGNLKDITDLIHVEPADNTRVFMPPVSKPE